MPTSEAIRAAFPAVGLVLRLPGQRWAGRATEGASMKDRRHNNKGERQVRRGKTADQLRAIAERLGIKFNAYPHGGRPQTRATPTDMPSREEKTCGDEVRKLQTKSGTK